jgi:hypothetical protein
MPSCLPLLTSHLHRVTTALAGHREVPPTALWPSVLDVQTGFYPAGDEAPRRVYRLIGAPRGSTLYWDQPLVVAAHAAAAAAGQPALAAAAERYVAEFLATCVAPTGMWLWGNHQYWDVFTRKIVSFSGNYHELRPLTPAWELFWRQAPELTATYLRRMGERHVYDATTGGFNRHDDGIRQHAFIESGGILAETLAWLSLKTGEHAPAELALRIAGYSFGHRGAATGLVRNEPDLGRWDAKVSTTEVGVWAQSLLRAHDYTRQEAFLAMARDAVAAYLRYGYDAAAERYYGQLEVERGTPVVAEKAGYWPGRHADAWTTEQWPTHDYPVALGEACLTLAALTGEAAFAEGATRLARQVVATSPGRTGRWAYAESYGRAIHFLARAGRQGDAQWLAAARALADEAVALLFRDGLFQGYTNSNRYEAVDGVGYLALALLALEQGDDPPLYGFGF